MSEERDMSHPNLRIYELIWTATRTAYIDSDTGKPSSTWTRPWRSPGSRR
jgi:hypothetical protein